MLYVLIILTFLLEARLSDAQLLFNPSVTYNSLYINTAQAFRGQFPCLDSSQSGHLVDLLRFDLELCNLNLEPISIDLDSLLFVRLYGSNETASYLLAEMIKSLPYLRDSRCPQTSKLHYFTGDPRFLSAGCCCFYPKANDCQWLYLGDHDSLDFSLWNTIELELDLDSEHQSIVLKHNGPSTPEFLLRRVSTEDQFNWSALFLLPAGILSLILLRYLKQAQGRKIKAHKLDKA